MITVVADSNVFISALVFGGRPRRILELAEAGTFSLVVCPHLRDEVEEVLIRKFGWPPGYARIACQPLWAISHQVRPKVHVKVAVDPDDDRILECAIEAQADIIVTGDRDLLRLGTFRSVAIMTPAAFLQRQPWHNQ